MAIPTRNQITQAHELANAAADNARTKQGRAYNTKVRGGTIKPGDRVLVKIVAFKERKYKLADRWEHDAYHVISQPNSDTPVFSVKRGNGEGRIRTLHRNLLLPIGFISDTPTPAPREEQGDSDSTIIENLPQVQADELQNTETGGDAQSSEDTLSVDEDLISEDERSASQDEIVQEDTLEQDTSQTDTDDEDEPVPIRRSARERRPPLRFTTGEFDMAKSAINTMSDWEKKIQCLKSISDQTTLLQDLQTEAGRAIVDILKSSTNAST
ncbi:Hypothetical predicted protein [Mytilus galloprovincialis]|uniref:Uncharacterized protein n=1 Tax=Mytilus galloprovincialis TaxID=29158 RepID=A0A8B6FYL5_MYTGA|nr:Hypothetical predicted protein [Mytilus galloprovincialis]